MGYQYPISRNDIQGLDLLEGWVMLLSPGDRENIMQALSDIGDLIYDNAIRLGLNEHIANLCEFSMRVGREVMSADLRIKYYNNNCWTTAPRDSITLSFKENSVNSKGCVNLDRTTRNAAISLYFSTNLGYDERFKKGVDAIVGYIEGKDLWSYKKTEIARNSVKSVPFSMNEYIIRTGGATD